MRGVIAAFIVSSLVSMALLIHGETLLAPKAKVRQVVREDFYSLERALTAYRIIEEYGRGLDREKREELVKVIMEESRRYGLDPLFVLAVIETESTYYYRARSRRGARGLMQIRYFVGKALSKEMDVEWKGVKTLYDPVDNVKLGIYYLAKLIERFGSIDVALTAYNYGPTYVSKLLARGQRLPLHYSRKVLRAYRELLDTYRTYAGMDRKGTENLYLAWKGLYR